MKLSEVIVTELLDTPMPWKKVIDEKFEQVYQWRIGDLLYELVAEELSTGHAHSAWEVSFTLENPPSDNEHPRGFTLSATGTGNELEIFSTCVDIIMNDVIPTVDPTTVYFSAEKFERGKATSRSSLYERLIKRYMPANYKLEVQRNQNDTLFLIKKLS